MEHPDLGDGAPDLYYPGGGQPSDPDDQGGGNQPNNNNKNKKDLPDKRPKDPKDDCGDGISDHKTAVNDIADMLFELESQNIINTSHPSFQDFKNLMMANPDVEHSMALWRLNDRYVGHGLTSGTEHNVQINYNHFTVANVHSHPSNNPPSISDIWTVINIAADTTCPRYEGMYVYNSNGDHYCIYVTDREAAAEFIQTNNRNDLIDPTTNDFINGSDMYNDYYTAAGKYSRLGDEDALCHAFSYIAEKYGMGIVVFRINKNTGRFESRHVIQDSNGIFWPAECK